MKKDYRQFEFYEPGRPARPEVIADLSYLDELEATWGRRWGAQSEMGRLRMAMVSVPTANEVSPEAEEDPIFYGLPSGLPDLALMKRQHRAFVKALEDFGVELVYLEVPQEYYGPYCRNRIMWAPASCFVINGGAILPRYGLAPWRKGHEVLMFKKLAEIGCPVLYTLHGKGVLELGGNGQWLDPKHLIIGLGPSGNLDGARQVEEVFRRAGVEEIHYAYFTGAIHLDIVFGMADAWLAVIDPVHLDHATQVYLRKKGIKCIEAPPEEAANAACNTLVLEPGRLLMPAGNPRTAGALREEGVTVIELEMSEFVKTGGGPHCATGNLIRDPGPFLK